MKKSVVVAYKIEDNLISVEVIEQNHIGKVLIYSKTRNSNLFNLFEYDNFIAETKNEIESIIKSKIKDVIIILKNSSNLLIHKKIVSNNEINNNFKENEIAKKLYLLQKSNNLYLFDYLYLNNTNKNLIALRLLDWNIAKNIFILFKKNNLNVLRMFDYDYLKNISFDFTNEQRIASFVSLEDQCLKIEILKNKVSILIKTFDLGIKYLVKLISNELNIDFNKAFIKFNLWALNLHAGDSKKIDLVVEKYLNLVEKEINIFLIQNKIELSKKQILFSSTFNLLKSNLFKNITVNNEFEKNNKLISSEMLGILTLIDNKVNTIKEMTITSELFVVNETNNNVKNYLFNYKK